MKVQPPRIDLFTTIHKGMRSLLFDIAADAARTDVSSTIAIDLLLERIARMLAFLDEHARHEDAHILPFLVSLNPELARSLGVDHRVLDALQTQVEACAEALAAAALGDRGAIGAQLVRLLNRLIVAHLTHMEREETHANEALWLGLSDDELSAVRGRIAGSVPSTRYVEWMQMIAPALNPAERTVVAGPVG